MASRLIAPILSALPCIASGGVAAEAYVRTDRPGRSPGAAARAWLVPSGNDASARFNLLDQAGDVVYRGSVGASSRRWGDYAVHPPDFPTGTPGRYTLSVTGK